MPQPLQLALGDHGLNTSAVGLSEYFSVRHTIMPSNSQDALEAAYVKTIQGLDVMAVGYPSFIAIEEGGDTDCLVYGNLCRGIKVLVLKDSAPESPKGS